GQPIVCRWCGLFSAPGPACDVCGSPLDDVPWLSIPQVTVQPLRPAPHPPVDWPNEGDTAFGEVGEDVATGSSPAPPVSGSAPEAVPAPVAAEPPVQPEHLSPRPPIRLLTPPVIPRIVRVR